MNKKLKIATIAVSAVMAGTMAFGMFGCTKKPNNGDNKAKPSVDAAGKLTWAEGTTLNLNVGNSNSTAKQGIAYVQYEISGTTVMPDGKTYSAGSLKPAWQALQEQLGVKLEDKFQNLSSNAQISTPISQKNLGDYDVITGSLEEINKNSDSFLNFSDYLDYMPNYKAFLTSNPVTKYSLTGNTKGGMFAAPYFDGNDDIEKYSMMNYNWIKQILDKDVDGLTGTFKGQAEAKKTASETDYGAVVATAPSVQAYMGKTGSYVVDTTDPAGTPNAEGVIPTTKLKVNYDNAKSEATTEGKALYEAIKTAAGNVAYTGESGNIVDLQNWAIEKSAGEVTGAQLANILREYIKVAYQKADGTAFYTTLSDVFISASAGWDVDLLVGISRVIVTATGLPEAQEVGSVFAIAGRQQTTQRRVDLVALAGELYGVRGLESRYEYTYFDKDGKIKDARAVADTYDVLNNFSALTKEGLVYIGSNDMSKNYDKQKEEDLIKPKAEGGKYGYTKKSDGYYEGDVKKADLEGYILDSAGERKFTWKASTVSTKKSGKQTFMLHDYVQTQTKEGLVTYPGQLDTYNFAPVVNAVSKWDVDGNGTIAADEYFRFTESWRSVKNTGFCIPKASVEANSDKLAAVLAFVDYIFSTDGQLLMSYGPQSTAGNENPNGWWYATEVTGKTPADIATKIADATNYAPAQYSVNKAYKASYFVYNEKVYTGTPYNGTQVPTITDLNEKFYLGKDISVGSNSIAMGKGNIGFNEKGNYTNYARRAIGSTLPIGNKNQGFEYQATARCGIDGAATVTKALLNGTLKHVKLNLDEGDSAWYLIAPTALPMTSSDQEVLKNSYQTKISGTYFLNNSATTQTTNVFIDLLYYGLGSSANICGQTSLGNYTTNNTGEKLVALLNGDKLNERIGVLENGWYAINTIYSLGYNLK